MNNATTSPDGGIGRAVALRVSAASTRSLADVLLLASFFLSGCSALVYQVAWQRAMYAQLGVDMDSVTIIVSVFMLGIGVGGMLGGSVADRLPRHRLALYAAIECAIGAYGLASLKLLPAMVAAFAPAGSSATATAVACFVFLLLPTVLMGMTLPLLTITFDEWRHNIGVSVGTLYFTNTIGAAAGAILVPFYLLVHWSLSQVVVIAAAGNLVVVCCALLAVLAAREPA